MATMAAVRLLGSGNLLSRTLCQKSTPLMASMIPRKSLALTSSTRGRIYGPDPTSASSPAATSHWKYERVVSAALLPVVPAAIMFPNFAFDSILTATLVLHTHWGLQGVIMDYIHVPGVKNALNASVMLLSILAFGGLFYLNYTDMGFGNAVRAVYSQL